jgi:hypothetical protein
MNSINKIKKHLQLQLEGKSAIEGVDSIDDQLDRYLSNYVKYATESEDLKNENINKIAENFLFEQEEQDKIDDKNQEMKEDEDVELKTLDDFDVRNYASNVANLVNNFNSLIEKKNSILRRAINYLSNNQYDARVIKKLEIILEDEYDLQIGKTDNEKDADIAIPRAAAAGPIS